MWIGAYAVAGLASLLPGAAPLAGLLVLGVMFACGEAAFSCSYQPLLLSSVPASDATRAASLSNALSSAGTALGPSFGVLLMSTGSAAAVWGSLATACVLVFLVTRLADGRDAMQKR